MINIEYGNDPREETGNWVTGLAFICLGVVVVVGLFLFAFVWAGVRVLSLIIKICVFEIAFRLFLCASVCVSASV